jgi:hypothetical protein
MAKKRSCGRLLSGIPPQTCGSREAHWPYDFVYCCHCSPGIFEPHQARVLEVQDPVMLLPALKDGRNLRTFLCQFDPQQPEYSLGWEDAHYLERASQMPTTPSLLELLRYELQQLPDQGGAIIALRFGLDRTLGGKRSWAVIQRRYPGALTFRLENTTARGLRSLTRSPLIHHAVMRWINTWAN